MIGCIRQIAAKGRNDPVLSYVDDLVLMEVQLYEPEGMSLRRREKRLWRLEGALYRQGIRRVILTEGFPYGDRLKLLRPVETESFYQAVGDVAALEWLRGRGIPPEEARVALAAPRVSGELRGAAERLCPLVRGLSLTVPEGGEELAGALHRRFGLPVTPGSAPADVTVAFAPVAGLSGAVVRLYGGGLRLSVPGLELPEDRAQPILALLWEGGRLKRGELRATFSPQTIANQGPLCYNN